MTTMWVPVDISCEFTQTTEESIWQSKHLNKETSEFVTRLSMEAWEKLCSTICVFVSKYTRTWGTFTFTKNRTMTFWFGSLDGRNRNYKKTLRTLWKSYDKISEILWSTTMRSNYVTETTFQYLKKDLLHLWSRPIYEFCKEPRQTTMLAAQRNLRGSYSSWMTQGLRYLCWRKNYTKYNLWTRSLWQKNYKDGQVLLK